MIQGMKLGPLVLAGTALFAIVYGVLFSTTYPLVEISTGIVALCVLAAWITCQLIAVGWNAVRPAGTTAAPTPPAPPTGADSPTPPPGSREH